MKCSSTSGKWSIIDRDGPGVVKAGEYRPKRERFPHMESESLVVTINAEDKCIRFYDMSVIDPQKLSCEPPFYTIYPRGVTMPGLLSVFPLPEARGIFLAYAEQAYGSSPHRNDREEEAEHAIETNNNPWRLIKRPDRCLMLAKDFIMAKSGSLHAVAIWSNGVAWYRQTLRCCSPPSDHDLVCHLPACSLDLETLREYFSERTAREILAAYKMNRQALFNLVKPK